MKVARQQVGDSSFYLKTDIYSQSGLLLHKTHSFMGCKIYFESNQLVLEQSQPTEACHAELSLSLPVNRYCTSDYSRVTACSEMYFGAQP